MIYMNRRMNKRMKQPVNQSIRQRQSYKTATAIPVREHRLLKTLCRPGCFAGVCFVSFWISFFALFCFDSVAEESARKIEKIWGIWRLQIEFTGKIRYNKSPLNVFWPRTIAFWNSDLVLRGDKCRLQNSCRRRRHAENWNNSIK